MRLNRSPFVRQLEALHVAAVAADSQTFAERLGRWLDWTDAAALYAALDDAGAASRCAHDPATATAAVADLGHVRGELAATIEDATAPDQEFADAADAAALRRRYQAQQQLMAERIGALRAGVRAALSTRSAALARLAALDAVFEQALAARERQLLATVPLLLERHIGRLPEPLPEQPGDRTPPARSDARAPQARRAAALLTMRRLLLAELASRLQPVEAMIDAVARAAGDVPALQA